MQEYLDFAARNPLLTAAWLGLAGTLVYTTVRARLSPVKTVVETVALRPTTGNWHLATGDIAKSLFSYVCLTYYWYLLVVSL